MFQLTITRPDDWHVHVRDGAVLEHVLPHLAARFARAIIMPNLTPPVTTVAMAHAYRDRILAALPATARLEPLMTLYLTDDTPPAEIDRAASSPYIHGVKLYPAGATTNSASGVTDLRNVTAVIERMQLRDVPLLIHGEVTDSDVDVFDREKVFIERSLTALCETFPQLRIVVEHITTHEAVEFVRAAREHVAATITAHHLALDRNALFAGGLRPHHYCLPLLKRSHHRLALVDAATSGEPRFFLGTDSAPHPVEAKHSACGCAGIYTSHAGIELYAECFAAVDRLDRLEGFASHFGADFYGLPRNTDTLTLDRRDAQVPPAFSFDGQHSVVPYRAGGTLTWSLVTDGQ